MERPSALVTHRPEPNATPRGLSACPSSALVGTGQAASSGEQAIHARCEVMPLPPGQAAVNHQADVFKGERALGDRTGQNPNLVPLLPGSAGAMARRWPSRLSCPCSGTTCQAPTPSLDSRVLLTRLISDRPGRNTRAVTSPRPWQVLILQGSQHLAVQGLIGARGLVARFHGMAAAGGALHGGLPPSFDVSRGRGPGRRLLKQSQGETAVPAAFVELVEDYAVHFLQAGVVLQAAQEDPIGDHAQCRSGGWCGAPS